jgi:transcriptional regulator with XRE-family HTH domain
MLNIDSLRSELVMVANVIKEHAEVAEKVGISVGYLTQIRQGKNATLDDEKNRKLLKKIICTYREIGRKKETELQKVL